MIKAKKGDRIHTSQYPWNKDTFLIEAIQNIKPVRILLCQNLKTNKLVNLLEPYCEIVKPKSVFSRFTNIQIIKLTKAGNKEALKEYLRRFKHMPKFSK